jgi:hypothetical protein
MGLVVERRLVLFIGARQELLVLLPNGAVALANSLFEPRAIYNCDGAPFFTDITSLLKIAG